jgi:hypothetical protein
MFLLYASFSLSQALDKIPKKPYFSFKKEQQKCYRHTIRIFVFMKPCES